MPWLKEMRKVRRTELLNLDKKIIKVFDSETNKITNAINGHLKTKQQRFSANFNRGKILKLIDHLYDMFAGKCCYCESFNPRSSMDIEHFRPKNGALGTRVGFLPYHYAWLSYDWDNLYLSCPSCNRIKADKFPVSNERCELFATGAELKKEKTLILDPCDTTEITAKHIRFAKDGYYYPLDKKGEVTIQVLGLNGGELPFRRIEAYLEASKVWDEYTVGEIDYETFIKAFDTSKEYTEARRQAIGEISNYDNERIIEPWFDDICKVKKLSTSKVIDIYTGEIETKNIHTQVNLNNKADFDEYLLKPIYIKKVELKNIGPITSLSLPFNDLDKPSWSMILGENGIGKSSILKAISFALLGDKIKDESFKDIVRLGAKKASVKIEFYNNYPPLKIEWSEEEEVKEIHSGMHGVLLCYGSVRLLSNQKHQDSKSDHHYSYKNLFDSFEPLSHPKSVLLDLDEEQFNYFSIALKDLLSLNKNLLVQRDKGNLYLNINGKSVPFDNLSDGYSSVIALAADMFNTIKRLNFQRPEDLVGIVLIDELGTHLHPSWRMKVVSALKKTFPKVQFICTTHEPLCLRGVCDNEVVVLKKTKRHKVFKVQNLPSLSGLKVEQILTSPHFGLNSTMEPEIHKLFESYYDLLAKSHYAELSEKQEEALANMRVQIHEIDGKNGILGYTRRDKLIYEAVDMVIALEKENSKDDIPVSERLAKGIKEILTKELER